MFHMVADANAPAFVEAGRLLSPIEAQARGMLRSVEGGIGKTRQATAASSMPVQLTEGQGALRAVDVARASEYARPGDILWQGALPGEVGAYEMQAALGVPSTIRASGAGKNWSSISFSDRPLPAYGNVGLMTTRSKMKGTPISLVDPPRYGGATREHQLLPTGRARGGLLQEITLPQAGGPLVYDPKTTPRGLAKKLKAKGAIPLNARFFRKLRGSQRAGSVAPAPRFSDLSGGNVSVAEKVRLAGGEEQAKRLFSVADELAPRPAWMRG